MRSQNLRMLSKGSSRGGRAHQIVGMQGIVPAHDCFSLYKFEKFALAHHRVGEVGAREFNCGRLSGPRAWDSRRADGALPNFERQMECVMPSVQSEAGARNRTSDRCHLSPVRWWRTFLMR